MLADVYDNGTTKVRYTLTTLDGFGRAVRVEQGYYSGQTRTPTSWTDTQYVACGCSPLGKAGDVSQPYTPNGTLVWAHQYLYDGLGRPTQDTISSGGITTYSYSGNATKVTPPIWNSVDAWKMNTTDALGNLTQVAEPDPKLGTVATSYQYDVLGHLTSVSMPRNGTTQTRTFNYSSGSTVGAYLLSATNPESGTVNYFHNADGTLKKKGDAKNQEVLYTYDSYKRVTTIQRGTFTGAWPNEAFTPIPAQETDFFYDLCPQGEGRLCTVTYTGTNAGETTNQLADAYTESYAYFPAGEVATKQFGMTRAWQISEGGRSSASLTFTANYSYDSEGRVTSVSYPALNNCSDTQNCTNVPGPAYQNSFDTMGRLSSMTRTDYAATIINNASYNAANELTCLGLGYASPGSSCGATGGYETRGYDPKTLLLTSINYAPNGNPQAFTVGYNYQSNLLLAQQVYSSYQPAFNQVVSHFYDSLNRLSEANTNSGDTLAWAHTYSYDGFGNLTATDTSTSQGVNAANNQLQGVCLISQQPCYDANGNQLYMPYAPYGTSGNVALSYDIENRLVQVGGTRSNGFAAVLGQYAYNHLNQRVWRLAAEGSTTPTEEIYFYGVDGQRLASYTLGARSPSQGNGNIATLTASASDVQVYSGHKLVQRGAYSSTAPGHFPAAFIGQDMVGSVRTDGSGNWSNFYPWGVEQGTATPNDRVKFGTYTRDGEAGLDYAMNRYYNSLTGRFLSADVSGRGVDQQDPRSWNRFGYVNGNPSSHNDPTGLFLDAEQCIDDPDACGAEDWGYGGGADPGCTVSSGDAFAGVPEPTPTPCAAADPGPDPTDCIDSFPSYEVTFVVDNYITANSLGLLDGIPGTWILGWGSLESYWGTKGVVTKNNNYFGWRGKGDVSCPKGANAGFGCFSDPGFLNSAATALFSTHNYFKYRGSVGDPAGQILASQYQLGATVTQAFDTLAHAGYTGDPGYGAGVNGRVNTVTKVEDCLRWDGLLP